MIGILFLVISGLAIAAYSVVFVFPQRESIVRVDDVNYTRGDLVKLLQAKQKQIELLGGSFKTGREIFEALQTLIETEMIAQVAPDYGVTVSDDEVDVEVRRMFASTVGDAQVDTRQLEREFQDRYGSFLNEIQLSKSKFRAEIRKQLLRERFKQYIGDGLIPGANQIPSEAPQARVHRIVLAPQDELALIRNRFETMLDGSSDPEVIRGAFKVLVREFSRDNAEMVRQGGDLGWAPQGVFQEYDDLIFRLEVGELSDQIPNFDDPTEIFFFVISQKDDSRRVEASDLEALKSQALQDWLNGERKNHDVYASLNSDIYSWLIEQLRLTTTITPTPAASNPLGL